MSAPPALFRRPAPPRVPAQPVVASGLVPEAVCACLEASRAPAPSRPFWPATPPRPPPRVSTSECPEAVVVPVPVPEQPAGAVVPRPRRYGSRHSRVATVSGSPFPGVRPVRGQHLALGAGAFAVLVAVLLLSLAPARLVDSALPSPDEPRSAPRAAWRIPLAALPGWLAGITAPPRVEEVTTPAGALVALGEGFGVVELAVVGNADVWIDGAARGVVQEGGHFTLEAGEHRVQVRTEAGIHDDVVTVAGGEAVRVDLRGAAEQG